MADMIAFVMYQGNMYTDAEMYSEEESPHLEGLLGEEIGESTGTIDEWSDESEYAREFASNIPGKVYTVQGYDPDFRLCVRRDFTDDSGVHRMWLHFLEHLNGISLSTGADLFEDRLQLRDRVTSIHPPTVSTKRAASRRGGARPVGRQGRIDVPSINPRRAVAGLSSHRVLCVCGCENLCACVSVSAVCDCACVVLGAPVCSTTSLAFTSHRLEASYWSWGAK